MNVALYNIDLSSISNLLPEWRINLYSLWGSNARKFWKIRKVIHSNLKLSYIFLIIYLNKLENFQWVPFLEEKCSEKTQNEDDSSSKWFKLEFRNIFYSFFIFDKTKFWFQIFLASYKGRVHYLLLWIRKVKKGPKNRFEKWSWNRAFYPENLRQGFLSSIEHTLYYWNRTI